MNKKSLLSVMLLCFAFFGVARADVVEIGDGGATNNSYLPGYNYYNYSLTQQIYTADEIGMAGTINSIAFKNTGAEKTRNYNVYMLLTDKETFTNGTDWVAMSDDDLVFSGTLTFTVGEWTTIDLEKSFAYDGSSNLLVGVADVTGSWASSPHMACLVFDATSQAIRAYRDTPGAYDITAPGVTGSVLNVKNQIQLDITASGAPVCTRPTLAVSNITDVEATLTCGSGSGTYNVQYKAASATDWNDVAMNTTETTFTITGLTGLTAYEARVQSVCDGGTTSDWRTVGFNTTATATVVGDAWADDFEGDACGWELVNGTCANAWVWGTAANNGGSHGLYISNDGGTTNAYTVTSSAMVYATKLLNFTEGKFEFSYNWMANGESTWDFLRVALVPASVTLTAGTSLPSGLSTTAVPTGWIALDGGGKLNLVSSWQSFNVAIDVPAGNYYLVMAWRDDSSGGAQPPAAIDNVSITKIACDYDVTDLAVSDITTTGATLSWDGGEATQWQVAYSTASNFEGATEEIVDEASYDMTGLQDNTTYYVRVRAYCGGNDFGPWASTQFKTACVASTEYPFIENFDSYTGVTSGTTNNLPDCWNYINGTTYSYYAGYPVVYNASGYSTSGNNHLRFYTYASYSGGTTTYDPRDQYAILPPMENLNGKQLTLSARGANANSTFKVGMMTDPTDASTFVEIATTAPTTSYAEYTYQLTGTGNYLAIMVEAANSTATSRTVYIDDITIDFPPLCPKPTGLAYADVTGHGVTLSWTENGEAEAWQICLNDDEENLIDVTENPYTLTDLAEETAYTVKVRANCGGNDGVSEWSNVVSFTTPQACPAPTGLTVSNITGHKATLNWNGSSDSYNVMFRTKASADGFYEEFSGSPAWEKYTGLLEYVLSDSIELTTTTAGWNYGTANGVFDRHAKINIWSTSIRYWLVSPSIEVAENYTFSFDLALTKFSGTLQPVADTLQQDDKFVVLVSTDDGSNWTILRQWDNAESEYVFNNIACSATGEHVSFDMSAYVGQNVRIAFYAESTEAGGDNNLHIDNVLVGIPIPAGEWQTYASDTTTYTLTGLNPETDYEVKVASSCPGEISHETAIVSFTTDVACLAPSGLAATVITPNSIELTWTDNNEATAWQIQVNEEDPIDVTTIPYVVENLESESTYTLKVRANCGTEGYSEWSSAINVTTLEACPVPADVEVSDITYNAATVTWTGYNESYVVMLFEGNKVMDVDFETGDLSQADFTTTAEYPWTVVEDTITGAHFAKSHSGADSQTSAMELEVTLTAESVLTFSAKISSESGWDKGYFAIDETYHINGISGNGAWINYSYTLPAGTHTLGWYYIKDSSLSSYDDCFYVDDIVINSFASGVEYTTDAQTYTFNNLTPETSYQVKVKGICDETETEWSEIATFTTPEITTLTQTIALSAGSNYFSTNLDVTLDDLKAALVATGNTNIIIKSRTQTHTYNPSNGRWTGRLTWDVTAMYIIVVGEACEITLEGMPIDPAEHPIIIRNGSNYIAFPLDESMSVTNAFAGFAVNGDVIKSRNATSTYVRNRWSGGVQNLTPGQGYIYVSGQSEDRILTFPQ